jgi:hypothetical protein
MARPVFSGKSGDTPVMREIYNRPVAVIIVRKFCTPGQAVTHKFPVPVKLPVTVGDEITGTVTHCAKKHDHRNEQSWME